MNSLLTPKKIIFCPSQTLKIEPWTPGRSSNFVLSSLPRKGRYPSGGRPREVGGNGGITFLDFFAGHRNQNTANRHLKQRELLMNVHFRYHPTTESKAEIGSVRVSQVVRFYAQCHKHMVEIVFNILGFVNGKKTIKE